MERKPMTPGRANEIGDRVNPENKAWVTVSYTANLGDNEYVKIEGGYSQTILNHDSPEQVIKEMENLISPIVVNKAESLRGQLSDRIRRNRL